MSTMASQITSLTVVYSTVYPGADQRKTSKLRVTGPCEGNSPVTGEFPARRDSNAEMSPFDVVFTQPTNSGLNAMRDRGL